MAPAFVWVQINLGQSGTVGQFQICMPIVFAKNQCLTHNLFSKLFTLLCIIFYLFAYFLFN